MITLLPCARWAAVGVFLAGSFCRAQDAFPLRQGEWEMKSESGGQAISLLACLTNETWKKALLQNATCKIDQFSLTSGGARYTLNCDAKTFQMKGPVELNFDGMEHMTGKATLTMTFSGKTTTTTGTTDFHYKNAACNPAVDVNLKARQTH